MSVQQEASQPQTTPLEEPELLTLTLEGMSRLGEAIAYHQGQPVYVLGGIPGEEVAAQVIRRRRFTAAQVVEVLKPSPHRVAPACPYFGICTGCQWQHVSYERQLEVKRRWLQEELGQVPGLGGPDVSPSIPAPQPYGYRNHARFTVRRGALGFVNRVTCQFVRIDRCLLMHPWINEALAKLQDRCDETTQLSIRYGESAGSWLIQPALRRPDIPLASGQTHYEEALFGRRFRIASPSFFQVNTQQTERLVELVRDRLQLTGQELLVDAYAGVGTIAILLTPYVRRAIAIEESTSAVKDGQLNAPGVYKVGFLQAKTEVALGQLQERPDVLVLDPPRVGCHPQALEALKRLAPRRVVYISCDPVALVRDLQRLCPEPYRLEGVQPIDMFPQTYHVECVATLSLGDGA